MRVYHTPRWSKSPLLKHRSEFLLPRRALLCFAASIFLFWPPAIFSAQYNLYMERWSAHFLSFISYCVPTTPLCSLSVPVEQIPIHGQRIPARTISVASDFATTKWLSSGMDITT